MRIPEFCARAGATESKMKEEKRRGNQGPNMMISPWLTKPLVMS